MIVGIDPAEAGAVTLLDEDGIALAVWSWRIRQMDNKPFYDVTFSQYNKAEPVKFPAYSGAEIVLDVPKVASHGVLHVACEDGFINMVDLQRIKNLGQLKRAQERNKSANPQAGLRVCRFGGACLGSIIGVASTMETIEMGEVGFIQAIGWRSKLLGVPPNTKSFKCKEISLKEIPELVPSIKHHLGIHGQLDHITDSAGVALWLKKVKGVK